MIVEILEHVNLLFLDLPVYPKIESQTWKNPNMTCPPFNWKQSTFQL